MIVSRAIVSVRPDRNQPSPHYIRHQLVADLFGNGGERGYLFRVQRERPGGAEILIHSARSPLDLEAVPIRRFGAVVGIESKEIDVKVVEGQGFDMAIRSNATRMRKADRKRLDVWDAERIEDQTVSAEDAYGRWLARTLDGAADVIGIQYLGREKVSIPRRRGQPIQFIASDLLARIVVRGGDSLRDLLLEGAGRAKAFGCGMPVLAPAGSLLVGTATKTTMAIA
jgi:CRISPR-associated protein Cas6/Cse3/CasE subtype I-E